MHKKRIALIGFGAIARDVLAQLNKQPEVYEWAVLHRSEKSEEINGGKHFTALQSVYDWRPDLVVEAAGHEAVRMYGLSCLAQGLPVLVSSVGALHDEALFEQLITAAEKGMTRLLLPSGAIGALDYVRASNFAGMQSIVYESRKPLQAWKDELEARGLDANNVSTPVILFEGPARDAARLYPANLNVAATLALAGIGLDRTQVRVVADPMLAGNQHHIEVRSDHGMMEVKFENTVSAVNPKTSQIVAKSLMSAIRHFFAPCQFL